MPGSKEGPCGRVRFPNFGLAAPDPELRARVAAAEEAADAAAAEEAADAAAAKGAADAAAAKEDGIDRKLHAFVTVMKSHGLTVANLEVLGRRLQG